MNNQIIEKRQRSNGKGVLARIDSYCGYCKKEIKSDYKICPYCKANLLSDIDYDGLGHAGREYYLSKI